MSAPKLPARLIGVSTKMYFDHPTTIAYLTAVASSAPPPSPTLLIFIIPSFPQLSLAAALLQPTPHIHLGAQDCHWDDRGAHTGSVSALQLAQVGCRMVELGHAERRRAPFHETDEMVGRKAAATVRNALIPLVCIGERGRSGVVSEGVGIAVRECVPQMRAVLDAVPPSAGVVFAYEPVWAIGAKEAAGADHVVAVVGALREVVRGREGEVRFVYGGSAGVGTWQGLKGGVDGLFLGRFAHDVGDFMKVIEEVGGE